MVAISGVEEGREQNKRRPPYQAAWAAGTTALIEHVMCSDRLAYGICTIASNMSSCPANSLAEVMTTRPL